MAEEWLFVLAPVTAYAAQEEEVADVPPARPHAALPRMVAVEMSPASALVTPVLLRLRNATTSPVATMRN